MKTLNVARAAFSVRHCCSTENRVAKQKTLAKFQKTEEFSFVHLSVVDDAIRELELALTLFPLMFRRPVIFTA